MNEAEPKLFPIQAHLLSRQKDGKVSMLVYMRAYDVYKHIHGEQKALIDLEGRNCRGGFSTAELVAFLYAYGYPRQEWSMRADEAFHGMQL